MTSPIRLPHLTWPQRVLAVCALALVGLVGGVTLDADRADAHSGTPTVSKPKCLEQGTTGWGVTLTVTADVQELNPEARIKSKDGDFTAPVDADGFSIFLTTTSAYLDVGVDWIRWDDGFYDPDFPWAKRIPRPDDCGGTTTTAPPTTTCAEAIPPREDCGGATTVPTTAAPPVDTTAAPAPTAPPTTIGTGGGETVPDVPTTIKRTVTIPKPVALPATGSSSTVIIVAGIAALVLGGGLLVAGRRGSEQ